MNHKQLITMLASKLDISIEDAEKMLTTFTECFKEQLLEDNVIGFQSFGTFEVKKKEERLFVHPVTQARSLFPPKMALFFKQSNVLKEKMNN